MDSDSGTNCPYHVPHGGVGHDNRKVGLVVDDTTPPPRLKREPRVCSACWHALFPGTFEAPPFLPWSRERLLNGLEQNNNTLLLFRSRRTTIAAVAPPQTQMLQPPYDIGARISTNSWGAVRTTYTSLDRQMDDFAYLKPDMVVVIAAGNCGDVISGCEHQVSATAGRLRDTEISMGISKVHGKSNGRRQRECRMPKRGPGDGSKKASSRPGNIQVAGCFRRRHEPTRVFCSLRGEEHVSCLPPSFSLSSQTTKKHIAGFTTPVRSVRYQRMCVILVKAAVVVTFSPADKYQANLPRAWYIVSPYSAPSTILVQKLSCPRARNLAVRYSTTATNTRWRRHRRRRRHGRTATTQKRGGPVCFAWINQPPPERVHFWGRIDPLSSPRQECRHGGGQRGEPKLGRPGRQRERGEHESTTKRDFVYHFLCREVTI